MVAADYVDSEIERRVLRAFGEYIGEHPEDLDRDQPYTFRPLEKEGLFACLQSRFKVCISKEEEDLLDADHVVPQNNFSRQFRDYALVLDQLVDYISGKVRYA